ncbi:MAG: thymidylate kinase Tmk [Candidatus Parcubacteria bacterium]|jgi:dTMP kinase
MKPFIVVEGLDGSGKGTTLERLKAEYAWPTEVVFTREPGGTPYAEVIRDVALNNPLAKGADGATLFHLVWAARHDHLQNLIKPALTAGKIVVCDRFDSSTYAYNVVAQGAEHLDELFWQTRKACLKDCRPSLYIILDVDAKVAQARIQNRPGGNHFDDRKMEFHEKVRAGLLKFREGLHKVWYYLRTDHETGEFGVEMAPRAELVDANRTPDEVYASVVRIIEEHLAVRSHKE